MFAFEKREYVETVPTNIECLLGADIGGTNSNFGIFQNKNGKLLLLLSLHVKSQKITDFTQVVKEVLDFLKTTYRITIKNSCFAGAGVVSPNRDYCKPTNLDFVIDAHDLTKNTNLTCATIANDFEIIGHGLDLVSPENIILVKDGTPQKHATRVIIGAGTGLGKSILFWHPKRNHYMPAPSEGGHADFCAQNQQELDLIKFIQKNENRPCNISWEDVLSGNGIQRMYRFFASKNNNQKMHKKLKEQGLLPDKIFSARNLDQYAQKTYDLYTILYARCAKNFALDALSLGGVYIAGGIASKNIELFKQKIFSQEFVNCGKQMELLKNIPINIITDYNVSLYGAAQFMLLEKTCAF